MLDWRNIRLSNASRVLMTVLEDGNNHTRKELLTKLREHNKNVSLNHLTTYLSATRLIIEPHGYSILFTKQYNLGYYRLVRLVNSASANDQE